MSVDINQALVYNNTQLWSSFEHYVKYHQVCFLVEPLIHSKLVRPLVMLSFNSPKPTKGLDALTIGDDANKILQRVWKSKSLPPLLKTFAWRLIKVATSEREGRYSVHIDKHCSYCGAIETDQHLFFQMYSSYRDLVHC